MILRRALGLVILMTATPDTLAQNGDARARDPVAFLKVAQKAGKWNEPATPTKIVGPLYFVGTKGLSAWLITTFEGHILVNSAMPAAGPMILKSVRKLGFLPDDIRILLVGHAHIDHAGAHAYIRRLSGARVAAMAQEIDLLQSGGRLDFQYGAYREFAFAPVKVDQVLHHGETIRLGNVAVTALLTPGHTKGSTTYVVSLADGGRAYTVVLPDGAGINPGYRLTNNPFYPGIAEDYRRTFHTLEKLKPDIWLHAHTEVFDFERKRARAARMGVVAWVDPAGYRRWLRGARERFQTGNPEMAIALRRTAND